jgi:DNA-binding transcriptional regulator YiaG
MERVICPACGRRSATERELPEYRYGGCGLPGIVLRGGAFETSCSECDEKHFHVVKLGQLLQVIAVSLLTSPNHLLGPELKYLRGACELSQQQLARVLRCRRATVAEREAAGQSRTSEAEQVWIRLVLLREFRRYLERWPDRNFLSRPHLDRLDAFDREFSHRALELARRGIRLHKQELRMHADGTWGAAEAA